MQIHRIVGRGIVTHHVDLDSNDALAPLHRKKVVITHGPSAGVTSSSRRPIENGVDGWTVSFVHRLGTVSIRG